MKIKLLIIYTIALGGLAFHFGHQTGPVNDHLVMVENIKHDCAVNVLAMAIPNHALGAK